jgi:hypothetical protein
MSIMGQTGFLGALERYKRRYERPESVFLGPFLPRATPLASNGK